MSDLPGSKINLIKNVCRTGVSLSLVRVGESVRLAVMADQQLWPHHAALPASFLAQLREMATSLQVGARSPRPSPPPPTIPALLRLEEESLVD
jgi:hypothetical protein